MTPATPVDGRSDLRILLTVMRDYVWRVRYVRGLFWIALLMTASARFLEVYVADMYSAIAQTLRAGDDLSAILTQYAVLYALSVVLSELMGYLVCAAGQIANRRANRGTYRFFLRLAPDSFARFGKGEIQYTVARRSQAVQDIIDVCTLNFAPTFFTLLFVAHRVVHNLGVAPVLLTLGAVVLYAVATVRITARRNDIRRRINAETNAAADILVDGLLNHEVVCVHDSHEREVRRYDAALAPLERSSTALSRSLYTLNLAQRGIWCVLAIAVISVTTLGVFEAPITPERLTFFVGIMAILARSLDNFGFMYGKYCQAMVNIRLSETRHCVRADADTQTGEELEALEGGTMHYASAVASLGAEGLTVRARGEDGAPPILEGVAFTVRPGEKVAVVGKNGAGKSTLIRTLLLLRKADGGHVLINGINAACLAPASLRRLIAYVPQNATLFRGTVMDNIRYGNEKMQEEDVVQLALRMGLHSAITRLPQGYLTDVGDQGSALSGGERQKVAVLRALAVGAPILVMDEPTASLDARAEEDLMRRILGMPDLTVISIVHNHALRTHFNRTWVVGDGQVREVPATETVELGTWEGAPACVPAR